MSFSLFPLSSLTPSFFLAFLIYSLLMAPPLFSFFLSIIPPRGGVIFHSFLPPPILPFFAFLLPPFFCYHISLVWGGVSLIVYILFCFRPPFYLLGPPFFVFRFFRPPFFCPLSLFFFLFISPPYLPLKRALPPLF